MWPVRCHVHRHLVRLLLTVGCAAWFLVALIARLAR